MRKKLNFLFGMISFFVVTFLSVCHAAEIEETEVLINETQIARIISALEEVSQVQFGDYTFTCFSDVKNAKQDMQVVCEYIQKYLESISDDKMFIAADYILEYDGNYTMYWSEGNGSYVISCTLTSGEEIAKWEISYQKCDVKEVDPMRFPFDLSYGATEQEIMKQLENYPYHYGRNMTDSLNKEGCFTVYLPLEGAVEYVQLYTMPFDTMQYWEPYAQEGFSFPMEWQLAKVEYHLDKEFDSDIYIDGLIPILTEKWGNYQRIGDSTYSRDTNEVMKESTLLNSRFWEEYGFLYRDYESVGIDLDKETKHFFVQYDGRIALMLQIANTWTLD